MEKLWWQELTGEAKAEFEAAQEKYDNDEISKGEWSKITLRLMEEYNRRMAAPLRFTPRNGGGHWVNGLSATSWITPDGIIHVRSNIPGRAQFFEQMIRDESEYKRLYN